MKKEKIIILGKSGSGKNYLMDELKKLNLKPCVKLTTRPIRKGEIDGVDYFFISKEDFFSKLDMNNLLVYQEFLVKPLNSEEQLWYYGISKEEFEKSNVVILTPKEYYNIYSKYNRTDFFVVYLDIDKVTRKNRIFNRNDSNDSVERRMDADDQDFNIFIDYDLRITDPDFSASDIYSLVV